MTLVYKLHIEVLNELLPGRIAYAPALLAAHVTYKGLDPKRYEDFQKNVRASQLQAH